jgi:hypothetical protein
MKSTNILATLNSYLLKNTRSYGTKTNTWKSLQVKTTTTMATPHLIMKLYKQNMAKTSIKLAASELCGDVCAAECFGNGQKLLVVTVYVSPNAPAAIVNPGYFLTWRSILQKCAKCFSFWQGEVVRICQSDWWMTLTST